MNKALEIRLLDWPDARTAAEPIRLQVFVEEQKVPLELEWDEFDAISRHALAYVNHHAVATGRLLPDGHIGRRAVLPEWRGQGLGKAVLTTLMTEAARRGYADLLLHAQCQAEGCYRRFGFVAEGETFDEAGISHILMRRKTT